MTTPTADTGHRALVLDASPTVTLVVCGLLRRWGWRADAAPPPDDLAEIALVIADPAAAPARLAALRAAGIPWVALLAREALDQAGDADAHAEKPVRAPELEQAVAAALAAARPIDPDAIAELWGSAEDVIYRRVAAVFATEMQDRLAAIAQAAAADDRGRLLIEAHSIGSAAANVGAARISHTARLLEAAIPGADAALIASRAAAVLAIAARDLPALRALAGA